MRLIESVIYSVLLIAFLSLVQGTIINIAKTHRTTIQKEDKYVQDVFVYENFVKMCRRIEIDSNAENTKEELWDKEIKKLKESCELNSDLQIIEVQYTVDSCYIKWNSGGKNYTANYNLNQ